MSRDAAGAGAEQDLDLLVTRRLGSFRYTYTERDVILYALGLGCGTDNLKYTYERHAEFQVLPTFGVIPAFPATQALPMEHFLPDFDPAKALHGEHFLELKHAIPTSATLVTRPQIIDIQNKKGKGAVVVLRATTSDTLTGHEIAVNEFTSFCLGVSDFQGMRQPQPRCAAATASNVPPPRPPDAISEEVTSSNQAALYRLSGDYNPLHIDASVSGRAGFPRPILHGLCTFGISVKHVLRAFGGGDGDDGGSARHVSSVKVRFARHVFPGETLRVEMWSEDGGSRVVFRTRVVERDVLAITNAAVVFKEGSKGDSGPGNLVVAAPASKL